MKPTVRDLGSWCLRCHAWRGELGQEPTVDRYVAHLVAVFAAVKRVLRADATLFVNLSDSYSSGTSAGRKAPTTGVQNGQWERSGQIGDRRVNDPGIPAKNLMLVPDRFRLAMQASGWYVRSKMPWVKRNCLSGGTRVYVRSQKGDMPMTIKDMVRLDPATVQLWNGERWTQAVDWWETPRPDDAIEIELRSGERIGCTKDHRWPTRRGLVEARDLIVGDVIDWMPLPEPDQPRRPKMLTGDIGWLVGLYIAEGHRSGGAITITGHKDESDRWNLLRRIVDDYDGTMTMWLSESGNVARAHIRSTILDGVIDAYVSGDRACGKHLDVRCWRRNDEFLAAILEGYLGGDGHWDEQNRRWRIGFCENDALAADLRTLCARLDFGLRLKRCEHRFNGIPFPGWRGTVRTERLEPSAIPGAFKPTDDTEVVAIGKSRARKFWDIEVADEPHLFALASGVLTHNCMPESVTDRPVTAVEDVMLFTRSPRYFWDAEAVKRVNSPTRPDRIGLVKESSAKDLAIRSVGGNGLNPSSATPYGTNGRNFRTSDLFFDSLGLILDEEGSPLALDVNPAPFKDAHFATFPPKLVRPLILAGTSEKGCCAECGAPWVRVVEKGGIVSSGPNGLAHKPTSSHRESTYVRPGERPMEERGKDGYGDLPKRETKTTGWRPSCSCDATVVPCKVLDIFSGSGTTLLVSDQLGRDAIGIDLNPSYITMQTDRITNDAPLFAQVERA